MVGMLSGMPSSHTQLFGLSLSPASSRQQVMVRVPRFTALPRSGSCCCGHFESPTNGRLPPLPPPSISKKKKKLLNVKTNLKSLWYNLWAYKTKWKLLSWPMEKQQGFCGQDSLSIKGWSSFSLSYSSCPSSALGAQYTRGPKPICSHFAVPCVHTPHLRVLMAGKGRMW